MAAAAADRPRKLLVAGDALGNVAKLFGSVETQASKVGGFDALLCAGAFLAEDGGAGSELAAYVKGSSRVPVPCYFVDSSPALLQAAPGGRQMCENLHFLGGYGLRDICGLRVAFLSGRYDSAVYDTEGADFVGGAFTQQAIAGLRKLVSEEDPSRKGIDLLLTCGWPADIDQKMVDAALRPLDPDTTRPSWREYCAVALAELCVAVEPRYHVFGSADIFYQRPPFQVMRRGHVCRCVGLGRVGSTGKARKWLHALQLVPISVIKREELEKQPANITPSPFPLPGKKRPARSAPDDEPDAKRQADETTAAVLSSSLGAQALEMLLAGDAAGYAQLTATLSKATLLNGAVREAEDEELKKRMRLQREAELAAFQAAEEAAKALANKPAEERAAAIQRSKIQELEDCIDQNKKDEAEAWLEKPPGKGCVRYTFKEEGTLGLRLSRDKPPWVLEVRDGSLAAKKAPRVPIAGVVMAVNGYDLGEDKLNQEIAIPFLKTRPVILDILWPADQGTPTINRA